MTPSSTMHPLVFRTAHGPVFRTDRLAQLWLRVVLAALVVVVLSLAPQSTVSADAYGTALDNRFSDKPAVPPGTPAPQAGLEKGLKEQTRQDSQATQPASPAYSNRGDIGPWFVLSLFAAVALGTSVTVIKVKRQRERRAKLRAEREKEARAARMQGASMASGSAGNGQGRSAAADGSGGWSGANARLDTPALAIKRSNLNEQVVGLRGAIQKLSRTTETAERLRILLRIVGEVESLKKEAQVPELLPAMLLASTLEGLLRQLSAKSSDVSPAPLRAAAGAVDLLELLCGQPIRPDLANNPPMRLLVVDDDAVSRKAVCLALRKVFSEPDLATDGRIGLGLAERKPYDLILMDIEMPGLDGYEVCSRIQHTASNCATPVVFVTNHSDLDARAKSALAGGADLIAKPFLAFEIAVKALTLVLKVRAERERQTPLPQNANRPQEAAVPA